MCVDIYTYIRAGTEGFTGFRGPRGADGADGKPWGDAGMETPASAQAEQDTKIEAAVEAAVEADLETHEKAGVTEQEGKSQGKSREGKGKGKKRKGKKTDESIVVLARVRREQERIAAGRSQERARRLQTQMFHDVALRKQLAATVCLCTVEEGGREKERENARERKGERERERGGREKEGAKMIVCHHMFRHRGREREHERESERKKDGQR